MGAHKTRMTLFKGKEKGTGFIFRGYNSEDGVDQNN